MRDHWSEHEGEEQQEEEQEDMSVMTDGYGDGESGSAPSEVVDLVEEDGDKEGEEVEAAVGQLVEDDSQPVAPFENNQNQGSEEILAFGHDATAAVSPPIDESPTTSADQNEKPDLMPPPPVPVKKGRVVMVHGTPVELPQVGSASLLSPEHIKAVNLRVLELKHLDQLVISVFS